MDDPDLPSPAGQKEQTRLIVLWGAALAAATKVATVLLSLVLARLIAPDMYGQYGAVSTILLFVMSFSMQRFTENVFHKSPTLDDYHRHLAFGVLLHGALFLIVNLVALAITLDATLSKIAIYLHVGSLSILINVPRLLYTTHLRMRLQWKRIRSLTILSFLLYAPVSVLLAAKGLGVWALLMQNLLVPVPYAVALLVSERRLMGLNFDWRAYRAAFRFGIVRSGGAAVTTAYGALESLIFSLALDFATLGIFTRAKGLSQLATSWLSDQLGAILYPSLAAMASNGDAARRAAGLLLKVNLWTSGAVAVAVAAAPNAAVLALYGEGWTGVAELVRPVLLAAIAGSMITTCSLVLLTRSGPRRAITLDITAVAVNALGLLLVARGGVQVYSVYLGLANLALIAATLVYMVRMALLDSRDVTLALLPPALVCAVTQVVAALPAVVRAEASWPFPALGAAAAASGLALLAFARLLDPRGLATILDLLPGGGMFRRALLLRPGSRL
ncbi:MAG: oligosaccharide flippase family protein [Pseudomonadota bacterium]